MLQHTTHPSIHPSHPATCLSLLLAHQLPYEFFWVPSGLLVHPSSPVTPTRWFVSRIAHMPIMTHTSIQPVRNQLLRPQKPTPEKKHQNLERSIAKRNTKRKEIAFVPYSPGLPTVVVIEKLTIYDDFPSSSIRIG